MGRPATIVAATALLALLGCGGEPAPPEAEEPAPPKVDYQQEANRAEWVWDEKEANLRFCVSRDGQAEILRRLVTLGGFEQKVLTVVLTEGGKEVYSFSANEWTVFTRRGNLLYLADFCPIDDGCSVVAYDFKAKKELWKTKLQGIGPVGHSKYRNEVTIATTNGDALVVKGKEAVGRHIEFVDAKSGKTVGHKVFK